MARRGISMVGYYDNKELNIIRKFNQVWTKNKLIDTEASMLAGDSILGKFSIFYIETNTDSRDITGVHL